MAPNWDIVTGSDRMFWQITTHINILHSGLNGAVFHLADCYPEGAGFDSRVMHGFFPHEKEVEDIGLTNQPWKRRNPVC
jgi:hypothetical protein